MWWLKQALAKAVFNGRNGSSTCKATFGCSSTVCFTRGCLLIGVGLRFWKTPQVFTMGLVASIVIGVAAFRFQTSCKDYYMIILPAMVVCLDGLCWFSQRGQFVWVGVSLLALSYGHECLPPDWTVQCGQMDPALTDSLHTTAQACLRIGEDKGHPTKSQAIPVKLDLDDLDKWISDMPTGSIRIRHTGNQTMMVWPRFNGLRPDVLVPSRGLKQR